MASLRAARKCTTARDNTFVFAISEPIREVWIHSEAFSSKSPEHDADHGEADECSQSLRSVRSCEPDDGYD